jgi:hypothetical protein
VRSNRNDGADFVAWVSLGALVRGCTPVEVWTEGAPVREGAHALARRERGCALDRCRTPQDGGPPLHHAAQNGHADVVDKLLAAGAAMDVPSKVRGGR